MATEERSYAIFLPTSLDLNSRRANGKVKVVHGGTITEQTEMSILVSNEAINQIEAILRRDAISKFERIRSARDVISE